MGGAQQLVRSNCSGATAARAAAQFDATNNAFSNGVNGVAVNPVTPPSWGPYAGNNCAISVQITTSSASTFFTRLFGYNGMAESTQAVAAVTNGGVGACIYLLSPIVSTNFNGAHINAPQCSIAINDTANFNGASVAAPSIGYAGGNPNENGATFPMATPAPMLPVADPCSEFAGCAYLAANPPSTSGCTSFNGNGYNGPLTAKCYSNLNLNGANVTLGPGVYVLSGSSNFNGSTMTGSGVTFYVPNGHASQLQRRARDALAAHVGQLYGNALLSSAIEHRQRELQRQQQLL